MGRRRRSFILMFQAAFQVGFGVFNLPGQVGFHLGFKIAAHLVDAVVKFFVDLTQVLVQLFGLFVHGRSVKPRPKNVAGVLDDHEGVGVILGNDTFDFGNLGELYHHEQYLAGSAGIKPSASR